MIEYVLLATLLAGVSVFAMGNVGANASELFNTVNNALGESTGPGPIPPDPPDERPAYAMLYDDGSFVFQRSDTPDSDKTLVKSYTGFESSSTVPWKNDIPKVKNISFKDKISPITTHNWFNSMNNCVSMNLEKLDTSKVTDMSQMFYNCSSLVSLDVTNFNTTNVTTMSRMFADCSSLTSLDVTNFDTSKVTDMSYMFYYCSSLVSLDISNFNTTNVTNMSWMFSNCSKLTSLDVTNFNTTNVTNMDGMFEKCSSLVSLDVTNFNTSNVTYINQMFFGCSSLVSLDVSNFDTSKVTWMGHMFFQCSSLVSVGLPVDIASSPAVIEGANEEYNGISYMFTGDQKLKDAGQIPVWYVGTYATI